GEIGGAPSNPLEVAGDLGLDGAIARAPRGPSRPLPELRLSFATYDPQRVCEHCGEPRLERTIVGANAAKRFLQNLHEVWIRPRGAEAASPPGPGQRGQGTARCIAVARGDLPCLHGPRFGFLAASPAPEQACQPAQALT